MEALIRQYEDSFLSKEFCEDEERVGSRIHEEFNGIDVFGHPYRKADMVKKLASLHCDVPMDLSHAIGTQLAADVYMLRYESHDTSNGSIYAVFSIWKQSENGWQLFYHQGTKVKED